MDERLKDLELQLTQVIGRLTRVESRLDSLADEAPPTPVLIETPVAPDEAPSLTLTEGAFSNAAANLGRTLMIFGGAYLLRALTDFEFLPAVAGVLLGAAYALLWLFMSYRTGGQENRSARPVFYGIASVFLAMPIIVEASTRFQLLSGLQGATALAIFCGLALFVAVQRNLRSLAWVATTSGSLTALVLLRATHDAIPFAIFLLLLGMGTLWVVYSRNWKGLHWLGAVGADLGVAVVVLLSNADQWPINPSTANLLALALFLVYPLSFAIRSHIQRRTMGAFEVAQGLVVIGIAFWAAKMTSAAVGDPNTTLLGSLCLLLGVGSYLLAFTPETRSTRGRNFFFYTTVGLILIVGGSALVMTPGKAAAAWSFMAVLMAFFSGRYGRVTLSLQCTLLLLAAGVASGILGTGLQALTSGGAESWPPVTAWHLIVAIATVACLFIPVAQRSERWGVMAGLPQLIVLALSVWAVGGLMVAFLAPTIAGVPGAEVDLGALAALRTIILTLSAVTLALSSRHKRWPEARWLVYPVLALVGIKVILEDFPNGRPLTLFVALALVGGALILVARLLRRERSQPAAS